MTTFSFSGIFAVVLLECRQREVVPISKVDTKAEISPFVAVVIIVLVLAVAAAVATYPMYAKHKAAASDGNVAPGVTPEPALEPVPNVNPTPQQNPGPSTPPPAAPGQR